MQLPNKVYDILKIIVQHLLPGLAAVYFAISSMLDLPYCSEVLGVIASLETLIGGYLGISTNKYNKTKDGTLTIDTSDPEKDVYSLNIGVPLEELATRKNLNLKIDSNLEASQEKQSL